MKREKKEVNTPTINRIHQEIFVAHEQVVEPVGKLNDRTYYCTSCDESVIVYSFYGRESKASTRYFLYIIHYIYIP